MTDVVTRVVARGMAGAKKSARTGSNPKNRKRKNIREVGTEDLFLGIKP